MVSDSLNMSLNSSKYDNLPSPCKIFGKAERGVEEHLAASCNSRIFGKEAAQRRDSTGPDRQAA